MKKILIIAMLCFCVTGAVFAGPHHRHHHHNDGLGLAAGIVNLVGYGLNTILGPRVVVTPAPVMIPAAPTRVVVPQTVPQQVVIEPATVQYVQPAPVVVQQPTVYYQPAPVYYRPCPPPRGYYRPAPPPRHHGNHHGRGGRGGRR